MATGRSIRQHTTGVAFGACGDRLVALYHADHVYAFDISGSPACASMKGETYPFLPGQGCSVPARCHGNAEKKSYSEASTTPMEAETASNM